jgi:PAS domain S-box-containing protein
MWCSRDGIVTRYAVAVLCALAAIVVRAWLTPLWEHRFPYLTAYPAIIVAAWSGGFGPGVLTTVLCAIAAAYFWIPPTRTLLISAPSDLVALGVFVFIGVAISALNEAIRRRERQLDQVLESISDGFIVLDRGWRYRFVNERAAQLARRPRKALLGQRIWDEFPDLVGSAFEAEARRAMQEDLSRFIEFFDERRGLWSEVRMYPSRAGLAIYLQDITERKQAETASFHLMALVLSSADAIVSKDLNGIIRSWNPAAEKLFGFTAAEAVGRPIAIIIPPDRRHEEDDILGRIRQGLAVEDFETVRMRKDGTLVDISLTVSPVRSTAGELIGASKIARDISDRKRVEEERRSLLARERAARAEAEAASRAKDEFLAVLSHELRTPLNAVYGWANILQSTEVDEATAARGLDAIVRNANAQVQLIDDLLDVSRIVSGKMRLDVQNVDLASVVRAALDSMSPAAAAKEIRLQSVLDPRAGPITGDPNRLQQVVWNLLNNAVKFTPRGGRVQVHVQRVDSHVEIVVSDTGQGIDPELLPFVFERFRQGDSSSTREHAGLGLGLSLVRYLTELHGGSAFAYSLGRGKGATFTVKLPMPIVQVRPATVERPHPPTAPTVSSLGGARLDGLRVLLVDDDLDSLDLAGAILSSAGAVVKTCLSSPEALELIPQWRPDVLVSDIEMPGEDGYALIRRVRALDRSSGGGIPAVALTAYGRMEDRLRAIAAGYSMHVPKPVDPAELTTIVASLAGRS